MTMVRQLYFGSLDIALHHTFDPSGTQTPFELQQQLAPRFTVIPPLAEDRFLCGFGHIFAGGYAAGYYSVRMDLDPALVQRVPPVGASLASALAAWAEHNRSILSSAVQVGGGPQRRCIRRVRGGGS